MGTAAWGLLHGDSCMTGCVSTDLIHQMKNNAEVDLNLN